MNFDKYKFTGESVRLGDIATKYNGKLDNDELDKRRDDAWEELADLQEKLYAENKQSLLIVLQAMDAAGKDSTIGKLTKNLNAQGCQIHSFKKPSKAELAQDFLWRIHAAAPASGGITIFNRSHYEDVLIVKVHGWKSPEKIAARYHHINNFESLLADRGTRVIKFMLHVSPDYQLERFKRRLDIPGKNWKFNPGDLDERQHWADYMAAFESAIEQCGSEKSPWYVVPAENRKFRDYMIASVIKDALQEMSPEYPVPEFDPAEFNSDSIK